MPEKYVKGTLVYLFSNQATMKKVEEARAWTVWGSHMLIGGWATDIAMEDVALDSANFWVQIRGIRLELLLEYSVQNAAERIGEILMVD